MKTRAIADFSSKLRKVFCVGLLCGGCLAPMTGWAGHGYYGVRPGYARGGFTILPRCNDYQPYYFNNYTHFPYPTFGRHSHLAGYPYRNYGLYPAYPRSEPRIYVYPQNQCSTGARYGSRVINVISMPPRHIDEIYPRSFMEEDESLEPPEAPAPAPPPARASTAEEAWDLLQDGEARAALTAFAGLASGHPGEGLYQFGYGLAAALNEDKITASYALRRAMETQPGSLVFVPVAGVLEERLAELALNYESAVSQRPEDFNTRFLAAFMRHMLHEDTKAHEVIEESIRRGDTSPSMAALGKAVNQYLADMNQGTEEEAK